MLHESISMWETALFTLPDNDGNKLINPVEFDTYMARDLPRFRDMVRHVVTSLLLTLVTQHSLLFTSHLKMLCMNARSFTALFWCAWRGDVQAFAACTVAVTLCNTAQLTVWSTCCLASCHSLRPPGL
jgi:hypothetical protein